MSRLLAAAAVAALGMGGGIGMPSDEDMRLARRQRDLNAAFGLFRQAENLRAQAAKIHGRGRMKKKRALIKQAEGLEARALGLQGEAR
jgi:hypothetical protein